MGRRLLLFGALALGLLGFGVWVWMSQNKTVQQIQDVAKNMDLEAEVGVDLSLHGVELTQGEAGETQWRLTASKASYDQEHGRVEVDAPVVTYYLKDRAELKVTAAQGEVRQEEQSARLWPDVQATYLDNAISAEHLDWNGTDNTLTLTGGVRLAAPGMAVETSLLRVYLRENSLVAENGVSMVLTGGASIKEGVALP